MRIRLLSGILVTASLAILFTACQKKTEDTTVDYSGETTLHSDDESRFSTESDAVANDANGVIELTTGISGRTQNLNSIICDATVVVDTTANPRTITITYNGSNCAGTRTRTGVVVVSMAQGVRWKNAGAILNVSFQNLKITRVADNKSITINGTQTYTNVSGGLLINLPVLNTITHTITSSNMSVTFDNGQQRSWQVARRRVFTYNNGLVLTVTGFHTEGSTTGIAEWGTNRFGNSFTTAIVQPLVFREDCSARLVSGKVNHVTTHFNANVTFGLNSTGVPTGCPGNGTYYLKIEWTGPAGVPRSLILPY